MVTLVNNHVLLPHAPNWKADPQWQRAWRTQVVAGVTGAESRVAVRAGPRVTLKWQVMVADLQENARLDDRIRAALKLGKACAPYWGRGEKAEAEFQGSILVPGVWPWQVGDWVFAMAADRSWEAAQLDDVIVHSASQTELIPESAFAAVYPAGSLVWPMLFGELIAPNLEALTSWHGDTQLELREYAAPVSATIVGDYTPPGPEEDLAIPDMEIPTSFVVR